MIVTPDGVECGNFRIICSIYGIRLPDGTEIYGNKENIAELAKRLLNNNEISLDVLKEIAEFDSDIQNQILKLYLSGNPTYKKILAWAHKYKEFKKKGYEYLPTKEQLLLTSGTIVSFDPLKIDWVNVTFDNYVRWHSEFSFSVLGFGSYIRDAHMNKSDGPILERAVEAVPEKYTPIVRALSVISQCSSRKQKELLKSDNILSEVAKIQKYIHKKEMERMRKERYEDEYVQYTARRIHYSPNEELLIYSSGDNILIALSEMKAYCLTAPTETVGRYIVTGKKSKKMKITEIPPNELKSVLDLNYLQKITKKIPLPREQRRKLTEFLIYTKLATC